MEWKNEEGEKLVLAKQGYRVGLEFRLLERERERERKRREKEERQQQDGRTRKTLEGSSGS